MQTNTNAVKQQVKEHILSYYTIEELTNNLKGVKLPLQSNYNAGCELVENGDFLIYTEDVKNFLNGLGINPTNKEYTAVKSWKLYKHLLATEIVKLCKVD